jgi:hypothetical protein
VFLPTTALAELADANVFRWRLNQKVPYGVKPLTTT